MGYVQDFPQTKALIIYLCSQSTGLQTSIMDILNVKYCPKNTILPHYVSQLHLSIKIMATKQTEIYDIIFKL